VTSPWSDPSSAGDPGAPYAGPPQTTPPVYGNPYDAGPYGRPPYGQPPYGGHPGPWAPGYGYPGPWGPPPQAGPRRPGQVVGAAVLAFVQSGIVLLASLYVFMFASLARVAAQQDGGSTAVIDGLAGEGTALAVIQVLSVVALVVGGILALGRRRRPAWLVLVGALVVQVVLAVYWAVRLASLADDVPGPDATTAFAWFAVFFAAMPLVALGLVGFGPGRRWFADRPAGFPG
jgi:hypothetical protein